MSKEDKRYHGQDPDTPILPVVGAKETRISNKVLIWLLLAAVGSPWVKDVVPHGQNDEPSSTKTVLRELARTNVRIDDLTSKMNMRMDDLIEKFGSVEVEVAKINGRMSLTNRW